MSDYWNNYYDLNKTPFEESSFAKFALNYIEESVIDIGCGNGRDSVFFANNNLKTLGIDGSEVAINNLQNYENNNLEFLHVDISKINLSNLNKLNNAYCRFLFHAINENAEETLLSWIKVNIKHNLLVETRVMKDSEVEMSKHYRRKINPDKFIQKLSDHKMEVVFSEVSNKFAPYNKKYNVNDLKDDPEIHRVVVKVN